MACHYSAMNILVYNSWCLHVFLQGIFLGVKLGAHRILQTKYFQIISNAVVLVYTYINGACGFQLFHITMERFFFNRCESVLTCRLLLLFPFCWLYFLFCGCLIYPFSFFLLYNALKYSDTDPQSITSSYKYMYLCIF